MKFTGYYDVNGYKLCECDKVAALPIWEDEEIVVGRILEEDRDEWYIQNYADGSNAYCPQLFECAAIALIGRDNETCKADMWLKAIKYLSNAGAGT